MDFSDLQERNSRIDDILQITMALIGLIVASPLLVGIFLGIEIVGRWFAVPVLIVLMVMLLSAPFLYNRIRRWALDQVGDSLGRIVNVERSYSIFSNKLILGICEIYYSPVIHSKYAVSPAAFRIVFRDVDRGNCHIYLDQEKGERVEWKVRSKEWTSEATSELLEVFSRYAKKDMLVSSLEADKDKVTLKLYLGKFDEHQLLEFIYEVGSYLDVASKGYVGPKPPGPVPEVPAMRPVRDGLSYRI